MNKLIKIAFILLFVSVMGSFAGNAQTFELAPTSKVSTIIGDVTIAGTTFKGGTSTTGTTFIMRISKKSGKEYRSYLGKRTDQIYDGHPVWTKTIKGVETYWYFVINPSTNYPKKVKLMTK